MEYNKDNYHTIKHICDIDTFEFDTPKGLRNYRVVSGGSDGLYGECSKGSNYQIFNDLGIKNKEEYCSEIYGYPMHRSGDWPYTKSRDFEAFTRVVIALFQECDKQMGRIVQLKSEITNKYQIY